MMAHFFEVRLVRVVHEQAMVRVTMPDGATDEQAKDVAIAVAGVGGAQWERIGVPEGMKPTWAKRVG
jgi:hypothetical protein